MTNRKRSVRNLISAAVGHLLAVLIGLMLPRLFITRFGSEVNGLLGSISQILVYLGLFEAGVGAVALQALYGPVAGKEWTAINGILSATNIYYKRTSIIYFFALLALSAVYPLIVKAEMDFLTVFLIILFCGLPSVLSFYGQAKYILLLRAEGKNYIITNLAALVNVLIGLTKAALILLGLEVLPVIVVSFFIQLVQFVYITQYVKRNYKDISLSHEPDYKAVSQKNYMLVHQVSGLIFQNTDVLLLSAFSGLKVVSVYSIYKLVMSQLAHLTYILQSSVDFVLGQTFQTDLVKYTRRIDLFESYFSAVTFALYAVVYYVLFSFVSLYTYGITDITYADRNLVFLFVIIELLTVMRTPMLQTINYAGHFRKTTWRTVAESVINLSVSLLGVAFYGIYGVLAGTVIALLYRTNDIIIYSNTRLLRRSPMHTYMIHLLNTGVFVLVQILFSRVFQPIGSYIELIRTSILAALIALPLFILVQTVFWSGNRKTVCQHIKQILCDRANKKA